MAWKDITEPKDVKKTYAADADADVSDIDTDGGDPVGSIIIADNSGSTSVYMKFPAGYSKLG